MNLNDFLNSKNYPPELKQIIISIAHGSLKIYKKLNEADPSVIGSVGKKNVQNEDVQKLDLLANDVFIKIFKKNPGIHSILSEENEDVVSLSENGNYLVAMDPLDGSSNIDVNIPVGSIFSILKKTPDFFLTKGLSQQLACYVIYGTSTMLVFAINNEVHGFTLNMNLKKYILTHPKIVIPENGNIFSINEGNNSSINKKIIQYLDYCKKLDHNGKRTHTGRFVGSLVADFHRNMLKGGIFIYPETADRPQGQLRLIYECNPIAFIAKNAGGSSSNFNTSILEIVPNTIHERTSFVVGSKDMVKELLDICQL